MNRYLKYSLVVIVISIIGLAIYFFAVKSNRPADNQHQKEVYTCSMHPQIIRDKPGNCPICGMTLVKKITQNHLVENDSIENLLKPTDNFIVGNYQTTTPKDTTISSEINLPGIVAYDPTAAVNIAARIGGRIEKIYVNYKYQQINKGQKLFDLYSPELLTEQQNFIYLITNDALNGSIIKAAKQKLRLYGMTNNQINSLSVTKRANPIVSVYSPVYGIVQGKDNMTKSADDSMQNTNVTPEFLTVKEGDYVKKGEVVFKLLNTNKVWGIFNISQGSNSLIKINQSISISTELDETETITAKVNFVETQFNPEDKTNRIRVYLNNSTLKLPIGLRLQGIIKTNPLKAIWLQKQAFVSIGNKKIVFIKMRNGFKVREIKTGIETNDFVQIIDGISTQDTIAENAQYLIDSESFIKTE
ncbi:efflux RND transporter periplasmic adaptor subunit [Flavobacterium sp. GT3R68]|uniref:efflux RND transporter periplasmic adaptor subunit n=1 Tax=Flavobacterium sp. GT3R68 TaxID=2594437 RepID=UPI000F88771E|nr:efflux RND transporter periplasmic adaptor subunit [Flavobacterium sp. GT3R68]RTY89842.1 efflux RND transporter periplasmic adaptor subunit [Flavobacterium sp. GSN2]TRW89821.1 efflux RND transporter periplasmic adaptor subunit [Flavobacterium sp. GT3R68]